MALEKDSFSVYMKSEKASSQLPVTLGSCTPPINFPIPWNPIFLKEAADKRVEGYKSAAMQAIKDPMGVAESITQSFSDTYEDEGVAYVAGNVSTAFIPYVGMAGKSSTLAKVAGKIPNSNLSKVAGSSKVDVAAIVKKHNAFEGIKRGMGEFVQDVRGGMQVAGGSFGKVGDVAESGVASVSRSGGPYNVLNDSVSKIKTQIDRVNDGTSTPGIGEINTNARETSKHVNDLIIPENMEKWDYPPSKELYKKYETVYNNPEYYDQNTGEIHWPPNDGFVLGTQKLEILQPGMKIDRYGNPTGSFLAPESDSFTSRALAPHSEKAPYYVYEVIEDFEVTTGEISPWFDQPGGGTQIIKYKPNGRPYSVEELIDLGVIKQMTP